MAQRESLVQSSVSLRRWAQSTGTHRTPVLVALSIVAIASVVAGAAQQAQPICAIDMGSNTFRRIVGVFEAGKYTQQRLDKKTLGVGDDVARNGKISDAKLSEIDEALAAFKASCDKDGVGTVVAVGTAAFRDAPNGAAVIQLAARRGISMEIATEQRESELAYLVGSLGRDGLAVIDNGSRSIELVAREGQALPYLVFTQGYRVAYDEFFAKAGDPAAAVAAFRARLEQEVGKAPFMKNKMTLVGVEFGDMIEVLFEGVKVQGAVLTLRQMQETLSRITSAPASEFQALKKKPDVDRALPRLVAAVVLTEAFGYSQIELTDRELGTGLIVEAGLKKR